MLTMHLLVILEKIGFGVWEVWGFIFNDHLLDHYFQDHHTYYLTDMSLVDDVLTLLNSENSGFFMDLLTFGELMLDDAFGFLYYWLINVK